MLKIDHCRNRMLVLYLLQLNDYDPGLDDSSRRGRKDCGKNINQASELELEAGYHCGVNFSRNSEIFAPFLFNNL